MHVPNGNHKASVDDQSQDKYCCRGHGLRKGARKRSNGPEKHRHGYEAGEGKEVEDEKRRRRSSKVGHEIERYVKEDGSENFIW